MRDSGVDAERVTLSAILKTRSDESDGEFEKLQKFRMVPGHAVEVSRQEMKTCVSPF